MLVGFTVFTNQQTDQSPAPPPSRNRPHFSNIPKTRQRVMDTPAIPMPADQQELDVLTRLSIVRDKLLLLKQDRRNYICSRDVIPFHVEVIDQVRVLNEHRQSKQQKEENRGTALGPYITRGFLVPMADRQLCPQSTESSKAAFNSSHYFS